MPKREIKLSLDFSRKDNFPKFEVKQFDSLTLNITPLENGVAYSTANCTAKLYIGYHDEAYKQDTDITVNDNNIVVNVDRNILSKEGIAYAEIELTDNLGIATSSTFTFKIVPKIGEGANIPGQIDGFVTKYEKLISEFKSQVDNAVLDSKNITDNTINDVNVNVDNKINDIETRFNTLTSEQQKDSEVILARKGETSLKVKIDKIDEQFISIVNMNNIEFLNLEYFKKQENETDDTLRIQRALDYCIENDLTLLIPNKTYTVSRQGELTLKFGSSVRGYCIKLENKDNVKILMKGNIKVSLGDGNSSERPNVFVFKNCSGQFEGGVFKSVVNTSKQLYGGYPVLIEQCSNFTVENVKSYDMNGCVIGTSCISCKINNCYGENTLKDMSKCGSMFGFYGSNLCEVANSTCYGGTGDGDISLYGEGFRNKVINCKTYNSLQDLAINSSSTTAQGICVDAGQNHCVVESCYSYGYYYGYDVKTNIEDCVVTNNIAERCKMSFALRFGEAGGANVHCKFDGNTVLNPSNGNANIINPYNATWVGFLIENSGSFTIINNVIKSSSTYKSSEIGIGIKYLGDYNNNPTYIKPSVIANNVFFDEVGLGANTSQLNMCDIYINQTYNQSDIVINSNVFSGSFGYKTSTPFIQIDKARRVNISNNVFGRHDSTTLPILKVANCTLNLNNNTFDFHKHSILIVDSVSRLVVTNNFMSYNETYVNQITGTPTNSVVLIGNTLNGGSNTGFLANFSSGTSLKAIGNTCIGRGENTSHFTMASVVSELSCNVYV